MVVLWVVLAGALYALWGGGSWARGIAWALSFGALLLALGWVARRRGEQ
jgi:hypothetical protein